MSFWKKLWWTLFVWRIPYASDEELREVDAFVTQAANRLKDNSSGPCNELLADAVERVHRMYPEKLILAQDTVAEVLQKRRTPYISINKPERASYHHSSPSWDTFIVARMQYEICKQRGLVNVGFVSYPDHLVRSFLVYQRVGFKQVKAIQTADNQLLFHHPDSMYWSFRGRRWRYVLRELCARILFLLTGRL